MAELPAELERNFRGLRELDEKAFALEQQVEADCLQQLKAAARHADLLMVPGRHDSFVDETELNRQVLAWLSDLSA